MSPDSLQILSISEINRLARLALEKQLPSCWVRGEVSNLLKAGSGHWYFTLKDAGASARCVMFRTRNQFVDWAVGEGVQVEVRVQPSLYEPRGDFQLIVEALRQAGMGSLFEAYMRLKDKLKAEGLFTPERKKPLPPLPRTIGLITSPQAAALRDVLTTLQRRWPLARVILYPSGVQGEHAPRQLCQAVQQANQRAEADVLLLVRGGGSLEDLWAFNDEQLARTLVASRIPVVSGIGHETDFTIADFVADRRAPTPTGAAEMATPDATETMAGLAGTAARLARHLRARLDGAWQHRDHLHKRLRHPRERLRHQGDSLLHLTRRLAHARQNFLRLERANLSHLEGRLQNARPSPAGRREQLQQLHNRLARAMTQRQNLWQQKLAGLHTHLELLCPDQVLARGYCILRTAQGSLVTGTEQIRGGQKLDVELARGRLGVEVLELIQK
jgi:exodeoxyribonuclease VII large subunit